MWRQYSSTIPQWGIAEIKDPSIEKPELKVLPLKLGVGQNIIIALYDSLTAGDSFLELISTFPVRSPLFVPKPLRFFFLS